VGDIDNKGDYPCVNTGIIGNHCIFWLILLRFKTAPKLKSLKNTIGLKESAF
jgi:hypothetical protein